MFYNIHNENNTCTCEALLHCVQRLAPAPAPMGAGHPLLAGAQMPDSLQGDAVAVPAVLSRLPGSLALPKPLERMKSQPPPTGLPV